MEFRRWRCIGSSWVRKTRRPFEDGLNKPSSNERPEIGEDGLGLQPEFDSISVLQWSDKVFDT
jgi:hypothetical protein